MSPRLSRLLRVAIVGALFSGALGAAAQEEPAWKTLTPDGFVTDTADVLAPDEETALEADLEAYRRATSNEIAIVAIPTLSGAPIEDVALDIGRQWGVGAGERNNGVLLLMALEERALRIEVGYGLEGAVPDLAAKRIIDEAIVPAFRDGAYGEGIRAGVAALKEEIGAEYQGAPLARAAGVVRLVPSVLWAVVLLVILFGRLLARTKSWWLGGVLGGAVGAFLAIAERAWLVVPFLVLAGLVVDWLVSRAFRSAFVAAGRGGWWFGSGPGGWRSSGGGGGFGGGSFGGGGASGRW